MVSFSPGWNFAPPTGLKYNLVPSPQSQGKAPWGRGWLKYCCNYMLNFSAGAKRKIPWESLLRCENTVDAHARVSFSALHEKVRLAGLKILARFENTGLGFLARVELRPGLSPSPCNRQFDFKRICFRSRAEIRHVIRPVYAVDIW